MNKQWLEYCDKYLSLSVREQYLILLTGLVAVFFIIFHLFVDEKLVANKKLSEQISELSSTTKTLMLSAEQYQQALKRDPNRATRDKIVQLEDQMEQIDGKLLALTSELIDPIQMRYALLELLKLEPGVSLMSFELIGAKPLLSKAELSRGEQDSTDKTVEVEPLVISSNDTNLNLYRHGIKIKLSGSYFDLRDYLLQLEQLSWKFFWQDFNFTMKDYPMNELVIEIHSLGSKEDFVGV